MTGETSEEQLVTASYSGQTLDRWAWIGRARAAAAGALAPLRPERESQDGDRQSEGEDGGSDDAG